MPTEVVSPVGVDPIIAEARERWQRASEYEDKQREITLAAKRFRAGDQWDPAIRAAREGKNALQGIAAQPARPCLTIDRLSQPVRQVSNQIKTANFAIDVAPNGQGADDETAEIIKGHLRLIQNKARGEAPIEWAADGAIEGGIGWFRLRTEFVEEAPDAEAGIEAFDQELRLERITNNLTVYDDPSANKPTRSDAMFRFVTEDIQKDDLLERWPEDIYGDKVELRALEDFSGTGDPIAAKWVTKDQVRIAEYWRVTHTAEKWAVLKDGSIQQVPEFPKDAVQTRTVRRPKVECYKITACQILEKYDWLGSRIPLIPVLAEELNVDGQTILRGLITEGMDAQRMVNYTYSGAMEIYALGGKDPIIAAAGQIDAYKQMWQTANTYNYTYLPYDPIDVHGNMVPPPHREGRSAPIEASVALMHVSEEAIKATTGIFDPSLGKQDARDRSGRAIQALQGQADLSTSNYGDSVSRALIYAGELMVEILPKITRPGQILHVLGLDDEPQQVMVGQPFVKDDKGLPQAIPPEKVAELQEGMAQFYDLRRGKYAVTVVVGKANATKREEGAAALGELIPHLPPAMAAVATPDYVEQLSFPGSHKIAEKLRKALPPELQDQEEQGALPPQVQAQMQAMQAQLQQAQHIIETKQAEQMGTIEKAKIDAQASIQKAEMDAQVRLRIAEMDAHAVADKDLALQVMKNAAAIAVAHIGAAAKGASLQAHAMEESQALGHEAIQADADRQHEAQMADQQHQQALAQREQDAALTPPELPTDA